MQTDPALEPDRLKKVVNHPCRQCGAEMRYDATAQMLKCYNCGGTEELDRSNDLVQETALTDGVLRGDAQTAANLPVHNYACGNCGAVTSVDLTQVEVRCSFCSSTNVNEQAFDQRLIRPYGVLPFKVNEKDATAKFQEWIGSGWFRPNDLKKFAALQKMDGVYVPFWTYDAQTSSDWTAESGYYYYETEHYTDQNGNRQSRQVQRIRWEWSSGRFDHDFDDVTVVASKGLQQGMAEQVYPYSLKDVVNFDAKFLLGWKSEVYALDVRDGKKVADQIMARYIHSEVASRVPGDTHRNLQIDTNSWNETFKHLLLPIWIAAYQYNDKTYQVVVNGETGRIAGEKPWSWVKITLAVLAVAAVVAAVVYWKQTH